MHCFERKVLNFIVENNMFEAGDAVVLGVSGGADSTALLMVLYNLLNELDISLKVVHINHGLREEAKSEALYVESLCRERNLEFVLKEYDVHTLAFENNLGHEEMGRKLRYEAFSEALGAKKGKIAVAHNMNDLTETMLFHLFRGTGIKGLSSIQPVRDNVVRPLLNVTRKEIEEYLSDLGVAFCTDKSNFSDEYTRNRIRNIIMPSVLENVTESAVPHMAETASQLREIESYLEKQTAASFDECLIRKSDNEVVYDKGKFDLCDVLIQKLLSKQAIDILVPKNKDITHVHLEALSSLRKDAGYTEINLPYRLVAFVSYNETGIKRIDNETNEAVDYVLPINDSIDIPGLGTFKTNKFVKPKDYKPSQNQYTKSLDYDKINAIVRIRNRKEGDFLTVNKAFETKKLKDYFINEKIPASIRDRIPVLAVDSSIIWVVGYRISENVKVTENTKNILEITFVKEENIC